MWCLTDIFIWCIDNLIKTHCRRYLELGARPRCVLKFLVVVIELAIWETYHVVFPGVAPAGGIFKGMINTVSTGSSIECILEIQSRANDAMPIFQPAPMPGK